MPGSARGRWRPAVGYQLRAGPGDRRSFNNDHECSETAFHVTPRGLHQHANASGGNLKVHLALLCLCQVLPQPTGPNIPHAYPWHQMIRVWVKIQVQTSGQVFDPGSTVQLPRAPLRRRPRRGAPPRLNAVQPRLRLPVDNSNFKFPSRYWTCLKTVTTLSHESCISANSAVSRCQSQSKAAQK